MSGKYTIKVLNDNEFDALPIPDAGQSLGIADPATMTAYIRFTGIPEVDKHVLLHEIEHLIDQHGGEHSDHYENGFYYKKLGDSIRQIAPIALGFIPGAGPVLSAGMAAANVGIDNSRAQKAQRKAMSGFGGGSFMGGGMDSGGGGNQGGFPESPGFLTGAASPNVIQAPKGGAGAMGSPDGGGGNGNVIDRVRGFFSGRNPVGGF